MTNIKVFLKKKPFINSKIGDNDIITISPKLVTLQVNRSRVKPIIETKKFMHKDNLFFISEKVNNLNFYDDNLKNDVSHFMKGNGNGLLILAYGQTGSGKTHTIMGNNNELGLIHYYFKHLFKEINNSISDNNVYLSSFEIYNDSIYDLINNKIKLKSWMSILTYKSQYKINNMADVTKYLEISNKNKVMGATKINPNSSRSHTIYKIKVNNRPILFIDLAGTEKGNISLANNKELIKEATNINLSLFALKECIRSLREKHNYIPFRSSKLTIVLREIFQKQFNIRFIATLNPSSFQFHDTLDTIRYAISLSYSDLKQIEVFEKEDLTSQNHIINRNININIKPSKNNKKPVSVENLRNLDNNNNNDNNDNKKLNNNQKVLPISPINPNKDGFQNKYLKYINTLEHLLEKDKKLLKMAQLDKIDDKKLSRKALVYLLDKTDFFKKNRQDFINHAELQLPEASNKQILSAIEIKSDNALSITI